MGSEIKPVKSSSLIDHQRLRLGLLVGLVLFLTYLSSIIFYSLPFSYVEEMNEPVDANLREIEPVDANLVLDADEGELNQTEIKNFENILSKDSFVDINMNTSSVEEQVTSSLNQSVEDLNESKDANQREIETMDTNLMQDVDKGEINNQSNTNNFAIVPNDISMNNTSSTQKQITSNSNNSDERKEELKPKEINPLCDLSNPRTSICDMDGDIRIHGKSSSVVFVQSSETNSPHRNESWRIKPYARKMDGAAMAKTRNFTVESSKLYEDPRPCTFEHSVPGIVFSTEGYLGNFFHDFADVLIPLFLTSYQFGGEVQFLVTNFQSWWIGKYLQIMNNLSRYKIINLDNDDDNVHCFPRAIIGLHSHGELIIDASRSPNGYSMLDFTKFLRATYSLPRGSPLTIQEITPNKKPRLLIVARARRRKFTNLDEIVKMAKNSNYEVVVTEADRNMTHFAHIVNSCDVMMGVHGAGLTNFVFLPTNAVLIQIVPWGNLDQPARRCFDGSSKGMNLSYLQYDISLEESTLTELYSRDDPVLKDPDSLHKLGWNAMGAIYLVKQNVKLNVTRFRPVLLEAFKLLPK